MSIQAKQIVTPAAGVLFLVTGVSGVMMFFHWNAGLVKAAHEWLGMGFGAIALWHLVRHWAAFSNYLRRNVARAVMLGLLAVSVATVALTGVGGKGGPGTVFRALEAAPLSAVAPALGTSPEQAVALLNAADIPARPGQTLGDIARANQRSPMEVAALIARK